MTVVNQNNLRAILPGKIAQTVSLIAEEKKCSPKDALLQFYSSIASSTIFCKTLYPLSDK